MNKNRLANDEGDDIFSKHIKRFQILEEHLKAESSGDISDISK